MSKWPDVAYIDVVNYLIFKSVGLHHERTEKAQVAIGVQALPGWVDTPYPSQSDRKTSLISCEKVLIKNIISSNFYIYIVNWQKAPGTRHASAHGGSSDSIVKILDKLILK